MRFSGKGLMSLGLMVIAVCFVIKAIGWPLRTGIFPVVIGIPVFFLALSEFCFSLLGRKEGDGKREVIDFEFSEDISPEVARGRTLSIFLWVFGFFFLIVLVGFPVAVPLFLFLYMKLKGKEGWGVSFGLALVGGGAFYGLFVWLLEVPFLEGWLQKGLRTLGIG